MMRCKQTTKDSNPVNGDRVNKEGKRKFLGGFSLSEMGTRHFCFLALLVEDYVSLLKSERASTAAAEEDGAVITSNTVSNVVSNVERLKWPTMMTTPMSMERMKQ